MDNETRSHTYLPKHLRATPEEFELQSPQEIEAYISWQTVKQELGQFLVRFQLLETAVKR
jgi:hypothetical protein